jgi:hypothetical protein
MFLEDLHNELRARLHAIGCNALADDDERSPYEADTLLRGELRKLLTEIIASKRLDMSKLPLLTEVVRKAYLDSIARN